MVTHFEQRILSIFVFDNETPRHNAFLEAFHIANRKVTCREYLSNGFTAAFNLNILHRLNMKLGANFDAARFRHRVLWNYIESRIEMHLESTREQDVSIEHANLDLHFVPRETIHTENSYKFTDQGIRSLLKEVGFEIRGAWKDSCGWYTLTLACLR